MYDSSKSIWISWERQRRTIVLSQQFSSKLIILDNEYKYRTIRYMVLSLKTVILLAKTRPDIVFGQNPSMVLALLLCILKYIYGYVLVIDRHSNFMFGVNDSVIKKIFTYISDITIRLADITIVTNDYLKKHVDDRGGNGAVLEDKLPPFEMCTRPALNGKLKAVFVTSFSADEPIREVVEAYQKLGGSVSLYVTGDYKKCPEYGQYIGSGKGDITFTGFLNEHDYKNLLYSSDIVICLTKNEYTLTCGAYEGLAIGKPMILSNTETIKRYFSKGVIYADPDWQSIMECTLECIENYSHLLHEIAELKNDIEHSWANKFAKVNYLIAGYDGAKNYHECI